MDYVGCFPDYAYFYPQFEDSKYYVPAESAGRRAKTNPWKPTFARPDDPDLPPPPKGGQYTNYLDGPARIIPSIEKVTRSGENPVNLRLDQALRRCYDMARSRNRRYFALQGGGLCMATNSKNFMKWDRLDQKECRSCMKQCTKKSKPCGKTCQNKRRKCNKPVNQTCAHDDKKQMNKGFKGGGFFTNSVFEIKDLDYDPSELKEVPPSMPDEGGMDDYASFRYDEPVPGEEMDCPKFPDNFFPMSQAQMFSQQYFTIDNPIKGMLIDQSAGSGKTCLALNVIGNFMGKWKIFWVTRHSLRATPLKNLYKDICQIKLREIIDDPKPLTLKSSGEVLGTTRSEKIAFIRSDRGPAALKSYGIEIEKQRIITYDDMIRMILGKGAEGRKLREQQEERAPSGVKDMGYQTLFVFDEAHNLFTPALPEEERQMLDQVIPSFSYGGKTYKTPEDVYGNLGGLRSKLHGRDLIAAMLYHSYDVSGADSAKSLILTATPMSDSPVQLFQIMNLLLPHERQRLSLDVNDYYDPYSMKLKDEAVIQFAAAAHGRISYYNTTKNPTKFAKKLFFDRMDSVMHKFHQKIVEQEVEKAKARKDDSRKMVALYRNLGLCARVKGNMFSSEAVQEYERDLKRLETWDPEQEIKHQTELYHREVHAAREVFGLQVRASDAKSYERKREAYRKWVNKNADQVRAPTQPPKNLVDVLDVNGDLKPFDEWMAEGEARQEELHVPDSVQEKYRKLFGKFQAFEQKLERYSRGELKTKPRKPKLDDLMKEDGVTPKTEQEYYADKKVKRNLKPRDRSRYERLSRAFGDYQSRMVTYAQHAKQQLSWDHPDAAAFRAELPARNQQVEDVMDPYGQLMTMEDWFKAKLEPKRHKKSKKKYKGREAKYVKFLIRDPGTGLMRIRTLNEFLDIRKPNPTLDGEETRKGVSFLMWHKSFNEQAFRELMPYYAPKIHDCIENIVEIEKHAQETYGHGFKHTVFTFSVAGNGAEAPYGSRIVASAFHARSDLFRVLLVYKYEEVLDEKTGQKFRKLVLQYNAPKLKPGDQRWGVAVLSSKNMPNIHHRAYGGNQTVEYNASVVAATQEAFNDARNRYGDLVKVLVMDKAYTEGVEAYEDNIAHFLNRGLSRSELEQASARSARFCRSKSIPFFRGVGGFLEMYFYALTIPEGQTDLYEQMLDHVPYEDQLNLNLMDVFQDLAAQFSIDYWLNFNINEYDPVFKGEVVDYYDKWNRSYVVGQNLEWSNPQGENQKAKPSRLDYEFMVDPDSLVVKPFKEGTRVTDQNGVPGTVVSYDRDTDMYTVRYPSPLGHAVAEMDLPPGPSHQAMSEHDRKHHSEDPRTARATGIKHVQLVEDQKSADTLRVAPGQEVEFHIPYGVDMAQKVMNIGNYNTMHPSALVTDMERDLRIPENALSAVFTGFRDNVNMVLLGFLSMLRMVVKMGGAGVPLHLVLPDPDDLDTAPSLTNFTMQWVCQETGERELIVRNERFQSFLAPKKGLSFMMLYLNGAKCGSATKTSHTNLLVYNPEWKTVERFDPLGYTAHWYDSVALDAKLFDMFQKVDSEIRFMSAAETCPLFGLHRLQARENSRHKMDPRSFASAFTILYMHMRIMNASHALATRQDESKRQTYPLQFQRGLIHQMQKNFKGQLTHYIRNYAHLAAESSDFVKQWDQYDYDFPFWANAVLMIRDMEKVAAIRTKVHEKSKTKPGRKDKDDSSASSSPGSFSSGMMGKLKKLFTFW